MRHWRTTGNSNVAIQTGSTYISDSMTDITTIPTANLGFSNKASSQNVSTSDYNVERQPEIAIWPSKPENSYTTGTTTYGVEIPTASPGFSIWRARIKCRQVIATMTDNRKWQCVRQNRKYLHLWNYDR